ncbi:hypothetical protein EK21DRAFT_119240 [Setomelanomma holmii]|uniref:Uncharacterized protein n=1 Tax=Setomelanomma holmii TaxID=210430 RepID=A0A9P4GXF4_9PLEO|nr:hypothetical protein EK21DRAFT_119240 [Setomelanomma holmii]
MSGSSQSSQPVLVASQKRRLEEDVPQLTNKRITTEQSRAACEVLPQPLNSFGAATQAVGNETSTQTVQTIPVSHASQIPGKLIPGHIYTNSSGELIRFKVIAPSATRQLLQEQAKAYAARSLMPAPSPLPNISVLQQLGAMQQTPLHSSCRGGTKVAEAYSQNQQVQAQEQHRRVPTTSDEYFALYHPVPDPRQPPVEKITPGPQQQPAGASPKDPWSWLRITDQMQADVQAHLHLAVSQIEIPGPKIIPGIPKNFLMNFAQQPQLLKPRDIWKFRHLQPQFRLQKYLALARLCQQMRQLSSFGEQYWNAWKSLREESVKLRQAEHTYYAWFFEESNLTEEKQQMRYSHWDQMTTTYEIPLKIDSFLKKLSPLPKAPQEPPVEVKVVSRRAYVEEVYPHVEAPPTKAVQPSTRTSQHQRHDDRVYDTKLQDQYLRHRKGEDIGIEPAYKAEHAWAGTGACSKNYSWMAEVDGKETEHRKRHAVEDGNNLHSRSHEENLKLHPSERCYAKDFVSLPGYPEAKPENCTRRPGPDKDKPGKWRCLHKDHDCADGSCTKKNHKCCCEGYTLSQLKTAIRKAISTWESQVERLIHDGKLDSRHRTWTTRRNNALRKREVQDAEKQAEKKAKETSGKTPPPHTAEEVAAEEEPDQRLKEQQERGYQKAKEDSRRLFMTRKKPD